MEKILSPTIKNLLSIKTNHDKESLLMLANHFESMLLPEPESEEAKKVISECEIMLSKLSNFIREKSKNL